MAFNPADFGITVAPRKKGRTAACGCYLRNTDKGDANSTQALELVMDKDTTDAVIRKFGERVDAGYDKNGRIFVFATEGIGRKVSVNKAVVSGKSVVCLNSITDEYKQLMGSFKRLYIEPEPYAGGQAIVFTPNGKRDML